MAQQDEVNVPEPLPDLPLAQLARVLSWLPLGERLACASVSHAWQAAAAEATTSLSVAGINQGKADQLSAWIAQYGEQLQELSARAHHSWGTPSLALATRRLPQVHSLQLDSMRLVDLPCTQQQQQQQQQAPSSLAGLPRLERMRLHCCTLAWQGGLAGLSALSRLQSLELRWLRGSGCSGVEVGAALARAWSQLRALTSLWLAQADLPAAALVGLGSCSKLQELHLDRCSLGHISLSPSEQPGVFSDIAQLRQLTSLALHGGAGSSVVPAQAPGGTAAEGEAPALSCLQRLQLAFLDLNPRALAELPQLQAISLENVEPLGASEEQATRQLLAQLGHQTQLVELELLDMPWPHALPAAAFAGLTASSQLTQLLLQQLALPAGVASHLFGAGRALPVLQGLCVHDCGEELFGRGDLQRLASAAPGLRSLRLDPPAGSNLQPLTRLSALTELSLGQELLHESGVVLAKLQSLRL